MKRCRASTIEAVAANRNTPAMAASKDFGNVVMDVLPFLERMGSAAGFGKSPPLVLVDPQILALWIRSITPRAMVHGNAVQRPNSWRAHAIFWRRFARPMRVGRVPRPVPPGGSRRAGRGDFGTSA